VFFVLIGLDDPSHKPVPYHILFGEIDKSYALYALQDISGLEET